MRQTENMREIKFRAWDSINKEMVYETNPKSFFGYCISNYTILQKYETVMQYTGMKDRDGVEIYEGDILETASNELVYVEFFERLVWDGGGSPHSGFYCRAWFDDWNQTDIEPNCLQYHAGFDNCKVIGNIYDKDL
jgi:uncharacterized phage protein (TIGR01671 family)